MRGALPPLPQYVFMAWCLVKHSGGSSLKFDSYSRPQDIFYGIWWLITVFTKTHIEILHWVSWIQAIIPSLKIYFSITITPIVMGPSHSSLLGILSEVSHVPTCATCFTISSLLILLLWDCHTDSSNYKAPHYYGAFAYIKTLNRKYKVTSLYAKWMNMKDRLERGIFDRSTDVWIDLLTNELLYSAV